MWVNRLKTLQVARSLALKTPQYRQLSVTSRSMKWLSHEEAKNAAEAPVGAAAGALDNPIWHTHTKDAMVPGDRLKPAYYRERPDYDLYWDRFMTKLMGTIFWTYVLYELYWKYEMLTGHWYIPYLEEFTDEELGIPPDNAPDPEYWGNHGKKYGTYR